MALIDPKDVSTVAVIGGGTIGASWSAWFLAQGCTVRCSDPSATARAAVTDLVSAAWPQLVALGTTEEALASALTRLILCETPAEAVEGADYVQENAPERIQLKQTLLAEIDALLPPDRVIGSSTSGCMPSDMQVRMAHPERLVVAHPFNPPHLIPLVEIVGGNRTAPGAVDWALSFFNARGKRAIHVRREVPGHIANRLQAALWREATYLVQSGVASVADVDTAMTEGPGLRWALMGPHLTFHLAGGAGGMGHFYDHLVPAMHTWWADLGTPDTTPALRAELVDGIREEVGTKTIPELAAARDRKLIALLRLLADDAKGEEAGT